MAARNVATHSTECLCKLLQHNVFTANSRDSGLLPLHHFDVDGNGVESKALMWTLAPPTRIRICISPISIQPGENGVQSVFQVLMPTLA